MIGELIAIIAPSLVVLAGAWFLWAKLGKTKEKQEKN